jgi:hypothetical protein
VARPLPVPDDFDDAVREYVAGTGANRIGARYGVTQKVAVRWLKSRGVPVRGPVTPVPADFEDAVRDYLAGASEQQLGHRYGIARRTVRRWLTESRVTVRGRSDAMRTRWAGMTDAERIALLAPSHEAARGPHPRDRVIARSAHRERQLTHVAADEQCLADALDRLGVEYRRQVAHAGYNVDFVVGPVAVEVTRAPFSHGHAAFRERHHTVLDGYRLLVYVRSPVEDAGLVADQLMAHVDAADRDPSVRGEYRVVGRRGQNLTGRRGDPYHRALVVAGEAQL